MMRSTCKLLAAGSCFWTSLAWAAPKALASSVALPGRETWQPYLDQNPLSPEQFVQDPWSAVVGFLPQGISGLLRTAAQSYAGLILFLLLAALVAFLAPEIAGRELLDLITVGGCSVLVWPQMMELAELVCQRMESWQLYLSGFLPVYAGVLVMGGENAAGYTASGLLLTALCMLGQAIGAGLPALLQCYLALSAACCISTGRGLGKACQGMGHLLCRLLGWAGRLFGLLLGVQRVCTVQLDRSALKLGQLVAGSIPVVGQSLSDAAETVLSGLKMLKSGLGLAALAVLGAEFIPLYLLLLLHIGLLSGCRLLCTTAQISRCADLFACLVQGVRCMAAVTALFFGIAAFGTALMFVVGGG